jgi:hypothetical protein
MPTLFLAIIISAEEKIIILLCNLISIFYLSYVWGVGHVLPHKHIFIFIFFVMRGLGHGSLNYLALDIAC